MVSFGSKVVMWVLTIFNLLWLILSGAFIYIGVCLCNWKKDYKSLSELADLDLTKMGTIILIIGVIVAIFSLLGTIGSCCESVCALKVYSSLILVLIGFEIYLMYASKHEKVNVMEKMGNATLKAIAEIRNNTKTAELLERFQFTVKCCGWSGPLDYVAMGGRTLPGSCCAINPIHPEGYRAKECAYDPKTGQISIEKDGTSKATSPGTSPGTSPTPTGPNTSSSSPAPSSSLKPKMRLERSVESSNATTKASFVTLATLGHKSTGAAANQTKVKGGLVGCKDKLEITYLQTLFGTSMGLFIVVILFELLIVFAACCLAREIQLQNPY